LVILGEAPGEEEEKARTPFVGASGRLLRNQLCPDAGLNANWFHILNTFAKRPPNNNLKLWTANKTELKKEGLTPIDPPLQKRYLRAEYWPLVEDTRSLLRKLQPDLIVGLGATALWLLSGESAITSFRGTFFDSPFGKAICTFHPAAVLRQYSYYPICWADLVKASQFIRGELPNPIKREFYINPTFAEIEQVYLRFLAQPLTPLGVDIETAPSTAQITTISYSTPSLGICIPLWDRYAKQDPSYWSASDEVKVWKWIDRFARLPNPKVLQNGLYDSQYMLEPIPTRLRNYTDDTSILHHALQPELPKDLGTLASLYLNEPAWKQMRKSAKDAKADE
jgi:DNA polymerase